MFNEKQIAFLKSLHLDVDFSSLSEEDLIRIEGVVGDRYTEAAEKTNEATDFILMCESILDQL